MLDADLKLETIFQEIFRARRVSLAAEKHPREPADVSVGLETAAPEIAAAFGDVPRQYATQVGKLGPHEAGAATPDAGRKWEQERCVGT